MISCTTTRPPGHAKLYRYNTCSVLKNRRPNWELQSTPAALPLVFDAEWGRKMDVGRTRAVLPRLESSCAFENFD